MGKLVYIIEDDEDIRFIVEYILRESGYEVDTFGTVSEYHAQLGDNVPDLVIIDVMLPDGNGLDICKEIRAQTAMHETKVIIMSAHASAESVLEQACSDHFISKPFDLDHFLRRVQNLIGTNDDN